MSNVVDHSSNGMASANGVIASVDHVFTSGINTVILWMLAISSLFIVAEVLGFLPAKVSEKLNRNRLRETMRLLKEFGVDVDTPKRVNGVARLEQIPGKDLSTRVTGRLADAKIEHPVEVGAAISVPGDHYIDLMGATADLRTAQMYARDLTAKWGELAGLGGPVSETDIDFVVTPKGGSPLLGACFADALRKPLLLHNETAKFRSNPEDPRALFDFRELPVQGSRGLIVDDSSTGGRKAERLIKDLLSCGWVVSDFLVVFEPQLKTVTNQNASARLRPLGVALHSIVRT